MALMSLFYNSEATTGAKALIRPKLRAALAIGNRAEAWFQIRYGSNAGTSKSVGIAARRFFESSVFGLHADPSHATVQEALQAYQVLQKNRPSILDYENSWGLNQPTQGQGDDAVHRACTAKELAGGRNRANWLGDAQYRGRNARSAKI